MNGYLSTIDEVKAHSKRVIGTLENTSYDEAMKKIDAANEKIVLTIYFKPGAHDFLSEYVYSPIREEWTIFQQDARRMCVKSPEIHVVDKKWAIPI